MNDQGALDVTVGSNLQGLESVQTVADVGALESLLLHDSEEDIGLDHSAGGRQADSNANAARTVKDDNEQRPILNYSVQHTEGSSRENKSQYRHS